jgi:hypothetical protein
MDLSKLLGELYTAEDDDLVVEAERPQEPDPVDTASAPDWSDEARLDQVFASWVPGPPSDAPAAEREMASSPLPAPVDEPRTAVEAGIAPAPSWTPADDDVLPYRRSGRRLSLLRR